MSDRLTYGATRQVLEINQYVATSATTPGLSGYRAADHDAAILLMNDRDCRLEDWEKRRCVALTISARAPKVRAALIDVFKRHKLDGAPCRTASDGSQTYLLRFDGYGQLTHRESAPAHGEPCDAAVSLDASAHRMKPESARSLRVDGTWKNGDPLSTPRAELPKYEDSEGFWTEIANVLKAHEPKVAYEPPAPRELTAEEKAEQAEGEKLAAQLAKRNNPEILALVEQRLFDMERSGLGTAWERGAMMSRARSVAGRISLYDKIVAERAEQEAQRGKPYTYVRA